MRVSGLWARTLQSLAGVGLLALAGCASFIHPLPARTALDQPDLHAAACRVHVHVFVINGLDPANVSNLTGMCSWLRDSGYPHVYFRQLPCVFYAGRQIERIHGEDPEARFVLIGYSMGVSAARHLAQRAKAAGIPIDTLICMDACSLNSIPTPHGDDAGRVVNVMTNGFLLVLETDPVPDAENIREEGVRHLALPSDPEMLGLLQRELDRVAAAGRGE